MRSNRRQPKKANRPQRPLALKQDPAEHIPNIAGSFNIHHSFQFWVTTALAEGAVKWEHLLNLVIVAYSATAGAALFEAVRIKKVRIWSPSTIPSGSSYQPSNILLTWGSRNALGNGKNNTISSVSMSTKAAHISASPPRDEEPAFWHNESTPSSAGGIAFTLTAPVQSIVQVDLELSMTPKSQVAALNALVSATSGQMYYRGLDGLAAASTSYTVMGVPAGSQI